VYYGDELRPGTNGADADGGSIYKFVPATAWTGKTVKALSESPLVSGSVYAYTASCVGKGSNSFPQFGQGCEVGEGAWVKVDASSPLTSTAAIQGATGYYRPEDGHFDRAYKGPGVKFCWANTGNEDAKNYAEVMCMIDTNPIGTGEKLVDNDAVNGFGLTYLADTAEAKGFAVSTVSRILEGDKDFNSFDNLDFQPVTGKMYVIEDHPFGDVFACLPDSASDRDLKVDGCIKTLSVRDSSAEPTGFTFTGDGKTAYMYIQHTDDSACVDGTDCAKNDGFVTDDLIKITGFKTKK
jgi:secreted PhoX family phosphatase